MFYVIFSLFWAVTSAYSYSTIKDKYPRPFLVQNCNSLIPRSRRWKNIWHSMVLFHWSFFNSKQQKYQGIFHTIMLSPLLFSNGWVLDTNNKYIAYILCQILLLPHITCQHIYIFQMVWSLTQKSKIQQHYILSFPIFFVVTST